LTKKSKEVLPEYRLLPSKPKQSIPEVASSVYNIGAPNAKAFFQKKRHYYENLSKDRQSTPTELDRQQMEPQASIPRLNEEENLSVQGVSLESPLQISKT